MKVQVVGYLLYSVFGSVASTSFYPQPKAFLCHSYGSSKKSSASTDVAHKTKYDTISSIHTVPRGGDLGRFAAKNLAQLFSVLVSIDALLGTLFPSASMELFGVKVPSKSIRRFSVESIGGVAGSLSVSSYLAVSGKVSTEEAIAYGLISRLFFLVRSILTNPGIALKTPMCTVKALIYVGLIFVILSGMAPAPTLALKAVIGFTLLTSLSSYLNPSKTGNTVYSIDTDSEGKD